jgi:hypothetical protein
MNGDGSSEVNTRQQSSELKREEVVVHSERLFQKAKETFSQMPEFQQAQAKLGDRRGKEYTTFDRNGSQYFVRISDEEKRLDVKKHLKPFSRANVSIMLKAGSKEDKERTAQDLPMVNYEGYTPENPLEKQLYNPPANTMETIVAVESFLNREVTPQQYQAK